MISMNNLSTQAANFDEDFTEKNYKKLLRVAKASYRFVTYDAIPWNTRFILWRHDLDYSINRAMALANIEAEEGVSSTYFINPKSEYYNPFEPGQTKLIKHILNLGHHLGLHFDAAHHNTEDEQTLHKEVEQQGRWLAETFDIRPVAFSFHNPGNAQFQSDADSYGGLINCYSRRFKAEVPYCSDSNGYWRFRRLYDVLIKAEDACLQILTHPGWWQYNSMPPRQRIFRSAYGRARSTIRTYDSDLDKHGRINQAGLAASIRFLETPHPRIFELCDYLWNAGYLKSLFVELSSLHERQINLLCKAELQKQWRVPEAEVKAFFESASLAISGPELFQVVFGTTWQNAVTLDEPEYQALIAFRDSVNHGRTAAPRQRLEDGCVFLCSTIESLAGWGKAQPIHCDGIVHEESSDDDAIWSANYSLTESLQNFTDKPSDLSNKKWEQFKFSILKNGTDQTLHLSFSATEKSLSTNRST
jgi:hypothetical protein